jgi:hypothetical protein
MQTFLILELEAKKVMDNSCQEIERQWYSELQPTSSRINNFIEFTQC